MEAIEVIEIHTGDIAHFSGLTRGDIGSYSIHRHSDDSLMLVDKNREMVDDMAHRLAVRFSLYLIPADAPEEARQYLRELH